jgi:hypothetical protein
MSDAEVYKQLHKMAGELAAHFPMDAVRWRANAITKDGTKAQALAYIDARDVMNRLDEVCSPFGWHSEHFGCGGARMGCKIGIESKDRIVWKSDGAGDSHVEAEKGSFSGAFKRAGVAWGIGRYLYDMDAVWVPCMSTKLNNGKFKFEKFTADPWSCVKSKPGPLTLDGSPEHVFKTISDELEMCASPAEVRGWWADKESTVRALVKASPELGQNMRDLYARRVDAVNQTLEKAKNMEEGLTV